ncbi:MAG: hydrogenase maturation protease [Elusimicrobia bacterium]|nr:hydrogenase maturation protease [Elusimicrobiota bacterium]
MTYCINKPLVLALGNDMLGDDGVAFHAAVALREEFGDRADILPTGEAGLPLLDHMAAYRRVLILDAAYTGLCPPGTILRWDREDFRRCVAPSQHAAGLPQLLDLAERLGLEFPSELRVVCMEVHDPTVFRESLTPEARRALPDMIAASRGIISSWTASPV